MNRCTQWRGEHACVFNHRVNYIDRLAKYEDLEMSPEEIEDTLSRFSSFLCEMTNNKMSKTNYTVISMTQCAEEAQNENCERYCDYLQTAREMEPYVDAAQENRLLILPVPVGQTVYRVHDRCRPPINACPFDGGFGISRCNGDKNCKEYYEPVPFRIESIAEWGVNLFETEEEAMDEISRRRSK